MLEGLHITKKYNDALALRDVAISVAPQSITTIIGPSGAGKTTLLHVLASVDTPDVGSISVDGIVSEYPLTRWPAPIGVSSRVSLVFQQLFLWPHLTLRENVLLSLCKKEDVDISEYHELVSLFGLDAIMSHYPNEASLGQRQRVALMRALVLHPKYLLLDEITSALDVERVSVIANRLRREAEKGMGILAVTHLVHFAKKISDRVVFMDKGEVIESGGVAIIDNPQTERAKDFLQYFD